MRADLSNQINRFDRRDWKFTGVVFVVALTIRLIFLLTSPDKDWPHSVFYEGDAPTWVAWANAMDRDESFEFNLPLRSPMVAYVLSRIHPGTIEQSLTPFKVLWCVFTSLGCSLAYLAFRMAFPRRVALVAAAFCVFSFASYIISTSLNNEAIYSMLLVAIVLFTLRFNRKPAPSIAILLALLHGFAMLTRAEHLLLFMMLMAWSAWFLIVARRPSNELTSQPLASLAIIVIGTLLTCLPWSIRGSLATREFNTVSTDVPDYANASPRWTADAQNYLDSLPAFARDGNFRYLTHLANEVGKHEVTRDDVIGFFTKQFHYTPEPLSEWTFLSLKGPLDFALANHPQAAGGFSKVALAVPGNPDPAIMFGRPDHLALVNHGYRAGWTYINSDFKVWVQNVVAKLEQFSKGVTLGFTSRNLPLGLEGERKPVDLFTSSNHIWRVAVLVLVLGGAILCIARRQGGIWLIVIAYKIVVAVLFYGYARQAVSILPAFFLLMALSLDQLAIWISAIWKPSALLLQIAVVLVMVSALAADFTGSFNRSVIMTIGSVRYAPHWGDTAFESLDTIRLVPVSETSSIKSPQ